MSLTPTRQIALALIVAASIFTTGCTDPVEAQNSVANVNGNTVSEAVLDVYAAGRYRKSAAELSDEERESALSELSDIYLLADLADKKGLNRDAEIIAQLTLQRKSILAQAFYKDFAESNPLSDEDLKAEYDKLTAESPDLQYKARHILLETEDAANAVIKQLDDGADFAELAKTESTGPSGPQGGDLGWFGADQMVPAFSSAVVALEDEAYSKTPVQTQFGYHVILREGSRQNPPPPFEDVKEQLRPAAEQNRFQDFLDTEKAKLEKS